MLARWQNQLNNNVGIGAACAACRVKGRDGGIDQNILIKNPNNHNALQLLRRSKIKSDQGQPINTTKPKNCGIFAVQALTSLPHL
jgi:hypothetical protein